MVDWSDPQEIARDSADFERIVFCFLGVTLWELFSTCDFEWSLLRGRRKFRWPLVRSRTIRSRLYLAHTLIGYATSLQILIIAEPASQVLFFLSRYCIIFAFIGLIVAISATTRINCGALFIFNSWAGNMTLLSSSTSLMLRTIALWERKKIVIIPLGLLCLSFWGILYRTMFIVRATWSDQVGACVVTQTEPSLLNVTFFFTMAFDFIILSYTFVALIAKHTVRTDLWKLLFHDGLVYFLVTFTANCIPAVFNVLNLNTPMNVIATIPAAAVSSIASCRAVMRLLDYTSSDVYVHSISGGPQSSGNAARGGHGTASAATPKFVTRPEVLVTTEHITMTEFQTAESESDSPYTKTSRTSITAGARNASEGYPRKKRDSSDSSNSMV